jgi:hypothetical protein
MATREVRWYAWAKCACRGIRCLNWMAHMMICASCLPQASWLAAALQVPPSVLLAVALQQMCWLQSLALQQMCCLQSLALAAGSPQARCCMKHQQPQCECPERLQQAVALPFHLLAYQLPAEAHHACAAVSRQMRHHLRVLACHGHGRSCCYDGVDPLVCSNPYRCSLAWHHLCHLHTPIPVKVTRAGRCLKVYCAPNNRPSCCF